MKSIIRQQEIIPLHQTINSAATNTINNNVNFIQFCENWQPLVHYRLYNIVRYQNRKYLHLIASSVGVVPGTNASIWEDWNAVVEKKVDSTPQPTAPTIAPVIDMSGFASSEALKSLVQQFKTFQFAVTNRFESIPNTKVSIQQLQDELKQQIKENIQSSEQTTSNLIEKLNFIQETKAEETSRIINTLQMQLEKLLLLQQQQLKATESIPTAIFTVSNSNLEAVNCLQLANDELWAQCKYDLEAIWVEFPPTLIVEMDSGVVESTPARRKTAAANKKKQPVAKTNYLTGKIIITTKLEEKGEAQSVISFYNSTNGKVVNVDANILDIFGTELAIAVEIESLSNIIKHKFTWNRCERNDISLRIVLDR
jgi:adenylate kinase family enzyme